MTELEVSEFAFAGQFMHAAFPVAFLYFPAAQLVHVPPSGPKKPVLHVQLINALHSLQEAPEFEGQDAHDPAPAVDHDATGQVIHAALPDTLLYLPATHCVHAPPLGPENPALQVQVVLADTEYELLRQDVHGALPVVFLYFPAAHLPHSTPSGPVYPTLQLQAPTVTLPATELEFVGQSMHAQISFALSYLPALHATQTLS